MLNCTCANALLAVLLHACASILFITRVFAPNLAHCCVSLFSGWGNMKMIATEIQIAMPVTSSSWLPN